jgi:hypothetical protein
VTGPDSTELGPSELRAAARAACQARGLYRRPSWDCLPFLAEDIGRLVNAVRREDLAAVRGELADCAAILDHLAELYDGRELAALVGEKVAADAQGGHAPAASVW